MKEITADNLLSDMGYTFTGYSAEEIGECWKYTKNDEVGGITFVRNGATISVIFGVLTPITEDDMNFLYSRMHFIRIIAMRVQQDKEFKFQRLIYAASPSQATGTTLIHILGGFGVKTIDDFQKCTLSELEKKKGIGKQAYAILVKVADSLRMGRG